MVGVSVSAGQPFLPRSETAGTFTDPPDKISEEERQRVLRLHPDNRMLSLFGTAAERRH